MVSRWGHPGGHQGRAGAAEAGREGVRGPAARSDFHVLAGVDDVEAADPEEDGEAQRIRWAGLRYLPQLSSPPGGGHAVGEAQDAVGEPGEPLHSR